jgi:hypothetical protein
MFPRSESSAAESAHQGELLFRADAPRRLTKMFTAQD